MKAFELPVLFIPLVEEAFSIGKELFFEDEFSGALVFPFADLIEASRCYKRELVGAERAVRGCDREASLIFGDGEGGVLGVIDAAWQSS